MIFKKKFKDAVDDLYLNGLIVGLNTAGAISGGDLQEFNECELKNTWNVMITKQ